MPLKRSNSSGQAIADHVPITIGFYMEGEAQSRQVAGYVFLIADVRLDGSLLMYVQGEGKVNISQSVISNGIITYNETCK